MVDRRTDRGRDGSGTNEEAALSHLEKVTEHNRITDHPDRIVHRLPFSRAQRALWSAQQAVGDNTPITIAHYVDISGDLDVDRLYRAVQSAQCDSGLGIARVHLRDGEPELLLDPAATPTAFARADFRDQADALGAALRWIEVDATRPRPLTPSEPLASSALLRVADDRWLLYSAAHHIAVDGYAAMTFVRTCAERYRGAPESDVLPAVADRWLEFIADEARYRDSTRYVRDRQYWTDTVGADDDPLILGRRVAGASAHRHRSGADLDSRRSAAIEATARACGLPSSAVFVAAVAWRVARLRDLAEVPLTIATSARTSPAARAAGGTISNLLPVTIPIGSADSVADLLRAVAGVAASALRHQHFRYEEIDGRHRVRRPLGHRGPVVNLAPFTPFDLGPGLRTRYQVVSTGPVSDVNINIYPSEKYCTRIELEANRQALSAADTDRALAGLLESLDELTAANGSTLLRTRVTAPVRMCRPPVDDATQLITCLFGADTASTASASAIQDTAGTLTYGELASRASNLGNRIRASGVRPGDPVAVVMPRGRYSVIAFWAVMFAGACVVPIDPAHPAERRRRILTDAQPRLILHHGPPPEDMPGEILVEVTENDPPAQAGPAVPTLTAPNSPAYLMYTSGSTGVPKGVVVTHCGIADLIDEIDNTYDLHPSNVMAHLASPGFDTAIVEMVAAARRRATLAVIPPKNAAGPDLADALHDLRVTHLLITPALLATLRPEQLPDLTHLVVGGDRCPAPLIAAWSSAVILRCAYGPTETTCSVLLTDVIAAEDVGDHVPLGYPMSGVTARVLDRRLLPVPADGEGELHISGPSLAMGYRNRPAENATRFVADPFGPLGARMYRTGDRVRVEASGDLIFLGRVDRQVKVHGVRIELGDVDAALLRTGLVRAATTVATVDDDRTRIHAYVVLAEECTPIVDVRRALARSAPAHLMPTSLTVVDALPMTVHNKVDHTRLPAPPSGVRGPVEPPATAGEELLVAAFRDALGHTSPLSVTADFFDLGGDSLAATRIAAAVNAQTGQHLGVRDVFEAPTPRSLAAQLVAAEATGEPITDDDPPADEVIRIRPAPAQRSIDLPDTGIANLIPFLLTIDGQVPTTLIEAGVESLLTRHDSLRSRHTADTMTIDPVPDPTRWQVDDVDPGGEFDLPDIPEPDPAAWARTRLHRPIDLAERYPLRVAVAHTTTSTHIAIVFHHIAVDGHSLGLLGRTLFTELDRDAQDVGRHLDYAAYCRRACAVETDTRSADLEFWRRELGEIVTLNGHTDRPRPARWQPTAARAHIRLSGPTWARIIDAAAHHRTAPLTILRAALARRLASVTGRSRIPIGALVSGRTDRRFDDTVGMFVITVPVVCDVHPDHAKTIADVGAAENRAYAHARLPLPDLVAELGAHRPDAHPLFQVMLTADTGPDAFVGAFGQGVHAQPLPVDHAKCDLHIAVTASHDGQDGQIEVLYATALFDDETVRGLVAGMLSHV
ncbi:amino acid adenylation domain-containing protein [Gordonia sp. ABSL1-1]|uniref:amino acid adenylation domain-containing protein n=1 Tax=Gordonia sp. ABSL1-1 TaxID=3053923 RepID=UPI0025737CE4|nr:amino acid adenylation domain-containing protein [Gordonia sp. ABSL1-1]MDL9937226.1 amino acid adenylation domain-containing protein [Gordonia sp. ABSL1-1]